MCVCVCWLRCHSIQVYRHVCCRFKFRDNEWRWMVVTLVSINVYVRFCQFHRIASLNLYTRGYLFLGVEWRSERWSEWKPLRIAININIACYWYSVVVMQAEAHSPKQTCKRANVQTCICVSWPDPSVWYQFGLQLRECSYGFFSQWTVCIFSFTIYSYICALVVVFEAYAIVLHADTHLTCIKMLKKKKEKSQGLN